MFEIWNGIGQVACPLCGDDDEVHCVHIADVVVNAGGRITHITDQGTATHEGEAEGRGARIRIRCWCESDHAFTLCFYFHKGATLLEYEDIRELPEGLDGLPYFASLPDLWRD